MQVDYAILSASMVDPGKGFLVHEQCEVDIATAMLRNASQAIMAVDHSKFSPQQQRPVVRQPALKHGDILVTDISPTSKFDSLLTGIDVRVAV